MSIQQFITKIGNYLSMVKFAHTIFALPFALFGFFMAAGKPDVSLNWLLLFLVILCMFFARNAAMSFNRWADREFDKKNPRTAIREIPAEIIRPGSALTFSLLNGMFFIATAWFINHLCFYLSPVALLVIMGYSLTKRFTYLSHFVLGLGLALAPTGAFLAFTGRFDWLPVILSTAVLCWVSGFDIIYALQDDDFDRENRLRSIPVQLGRKRALLLSSVLHIITAGLLLLMGIRGGYNIFYWIGYAAFTSLLFYQHIIVKADDLRRVNVAFFTLNGIASLIYALFGILGILL
jgi:4-hydroxybenzoate polyprenyltransferase